MMGINEMVREKAKAKTDGSDWFPPPNAEDDAYDYEGMRRRVKRRLNQKWI